MTKIKILVLSLISYSLFLFSFTVWAPVILLLHKLKLVKISAFQTSLKLWGRMQTFLMPCKLEIVGAENIEDGKNYVFILNHQSMLDITLALGYIPKNFVFLAKKELASIPVFGRVMKALQFIPIDRSNPKKARESLADAGKLMNEQNLSVSIFAEGTRTKTGKLGKFKKGGFILAQEANVEVVPVSINGNFKIAPTKTLFYREPGDLKLTIHKPISTTDKDLNKLIEEVRDIIAEDLKWNNYFFY